MYSSPRTSAQYTLVPSLRLRNFPHRRMRWDHHIRNPTTPDRPLDDDELDELLHEAKAVPIKVLGLVERAGANNAVEPALLEHVEPRVAVVVARRADDLRLRRQRPQQLVRRLQSLQVLSVHQHLVKTRNQGRAPAAKPSLAQFSFCVVRASNRWGNRGLELGGFMTNKLTDA